MAVIAMVAIAQLVERRIVIPDVAGSSPVGHPILDCYPKNHPQIHGSKEHELGIFFAIQALEI